MKKAITLLLALCLVLALFTACGKTEEKPEDSAKPASEDNTPATQQTDLSGLGTTGTEIKEAAAYEEDFTIGGQIQISTVDPQAVNDTAYVLKLVFDTLLSLAPDGTIAPNLATEWKAVDEYTYEFKLRDDVTFQDGSKFTADDVVYTFGERMLAIPGSNTASKLTSIDKVEAVDDYTVKIHLNSLNQDFLQFLAMPYASILSRSACTKDADKGFYIGTGPWKITEFVPGIKVEMERYDGFWGELPKPLRMHYIAYPEDNGRMIAIQSGEVDATIALPSTENETIRNATEYKGVSILDSGLAYVCFNTVDPVMSDVNLRKAIAYAIDYEEVIDIVCGGDAEMSGTFWGYGSYAEDKDLEGYSYNLDLAKEYMEKSNYDGSTISIMCAVPSNVTTATILVDRLADIGIKAVVDERDFVGVITNTAYDVHNYQMLCFNAMFGYSADDCSRRFYYTAASGNKVALSDPELDALIDAALVEPDTAKRIDMYKQVQQYNFDNVLYIPMGHSLYYCAQGLNVSGINWSADSTMHDFRYGCVAVGD